MLLEFRTSNYKSFVDEMVFSMEPASKQKGLDYSILNEKIGNVQQKGVCSAVIYGPNAAGKTNIIGALDTFRAIILRGNIRNASSKYSPNEAASSLELIPNVHSGNKPTEFGIRFTNDGVLYEYSLKADLGTFLDVSYKRRILDEQLAVNGKKVFVRNEDLAVELPKAIRPLVNSSIKRISPSLMKIAHNSLNDTELFLCNGFKSIFAQQFVTQMLDWFTNRLIVIYRSDESRIFRSLIDPKENTVYIDKTLTEAAREFGINSNALGYKAIGESNESVLCSIFADRNIAIPAESFESYGTIRFVNIFPLIIQALVNGATLVMDEFDASIHPMALMNIVNIFHNDDINRHRAQLIFNTHNPIFLDSSLFRRDEIKFVEREEDTKQSVHYSLSDFRTADGVRNGEDYMSNYFVDRYGAIENVDFAPMLEAIMDANEREKHE